MTLRSGPTERPKSRSRPVTLKSAHVVASSATSNQLSESLTCNGGDEEFFPARKSFTRKHLAWRKRTLAFVASSPKLFPIQTVHKSVALTRARLDEEASRLQAMASILCAIYGDPRIEGHFDPVDGLIYVLLTQQTSTQIAHVIFQEFRRVFKTWDVLVEAKPQQKSEISGFQGFGQKKLEVICRVLRIIRREFGSVSLESVCDWSDDQLFTFLTRLPGIDLTTAHCVMMFAFNRQVFPEDEHAQRVLGRLGVFQGFGLDLKRKSEKQRQAILADLIPPALRYILHVNLGIHGQTICRAAPEKHKCDDCALKKFCATYRETKVRKAEKSNRPTVVDLFCGAGGLSEGFHLAGFRTVLAVDQNPSAIRTYRLNHPEVPADRVLCEDLRDFNADAKRLRKVLGKQHVDVLIGGPPCQGFSRAGWRSRGNGQRFSPSKDDRNHLYAELINLLDQLQPQVVLMENVPGIGEVRFPDGSTFQDVTEEAMRNVGYTPTTWTLNAAHYGVPQLRFRRVIVGVRGKKAKPLTEPPPKYHAASNQFRYSNLQEELFSGLEQAITLGEAIGDLKSIGPDEGSWVSHRGAPRNPSRFLERNAITHPQELVFSHVSRFQNEQDLERFRSLEPGETYMDLIRKRPELKNYRTDAFDDKYYRLESDRPSKTIVAHLRKDGNSFVHPEQVRSLTVREAARLQSFSDEYIFTGSRGDQFEQIGNAVPPLMARAMADVISAHLKRQKNRG